MPKKPATNKKTTPSKKSSRPVSKPKATTQVKSKKKPASPQTSRASTTKHSPTTKKTSPTKHKTSASSPTPKSSASASKSGGFANFLVWAGVIIIIIGIIYFIIPEGEEKIDSDNLRYSSSELSDEEIAASMPTDFNQQTGTASENLGLVFDDPNFALSNQNAGNSATSDVDPNAPTPNPLAETGLEELNRLQETAITSTQEEIVQVSDQVNYTTTSIIGKIGELISGALSWARNWLFGTVDDLNLPTPEPLPAPSPTPTPTPAPTVEVLQINTVEVPVQ